MHSERNSGGITAALAFVVWNLAGGISVEAQEFRTFIGGSGTLWESPGNWNPDDVPDVPGEGAHIEANSPVVGGNHIISALELAGGGGLILSQNNTLTTSSLVYDGTGTISGSGELILQDAGTIGFGALAMATLRNEGVLVVNSALTLSSNAVFENVNTTDLKDNAAINATGGSTITNTGFIWKTTGTGIANLSAPVVNHLEISGRSGTLRVNGGGVSSGLFYTTSGARLEFRTLPFVLMDGAVISGAGDTELQQTFTLAEDASVNFDHFTFGFGNINGEGQIIFSGTNNIIKSGTLGGSVVSVVTNGAVVTLAGPGDPTVENAHKLVIRPGGTLLFKEAGSRLISNGGGSVLVQGTVDFADNGDLTVNSGSPLLITNMGVIVKSGGNNSGDSTLHADITHRGTFEIQEGLLRLQGNEVIESPITIQPGARLRIQGTTSLLMKKGAAVSGGGAFEHANGGIEVEHGARVTVEGYETLLSGGRVAGEGTFVIGTSGTIESIIHSGMGVTEIPEGVTVTTGNAFDLDGGRTLRNLGNLEIASTFGSSISDSASIENFGTMTVTAGPSLSLGSGDFRIRNEGAWICKIPSNTFASFPPTDYSGGGLLSVQSGKLRLLQDVTLSGTIEVRENSELYCNNLGFAADSILKGNGRMVGSVNFGGRVQPGESIGSLQVSGNASFSSGGVLETELGPGMNDLLEVSSSLILSNASMSISLAPGFTPTPGQSWTNVTAGTISGVFSKVVQAPPAGFGFFVGFSNQFITVTYSAATNFPQAWDAASGQTLAPGTDLSTVVGEDLDGDGLPNLFEWAFGGSLSAKDPDLRFELKSVTFGNTRTVIFRYPLNPLATDVALAIEGAESPGAGFSEKAFTPTSTETSGGVLYQLVELTLPSTDPTRYFRMRARLLE